MSHNECANCSLSDIVSFFCFGPERTAGRIIIRLEILSRIGFGKCSHIIQKATTEMRALILGALAAIASARGVRKSRPSSAQAGGSGVATLLWVQHEDTAVYTSSGLSRHPGTTPTFATA